MVYYNPFKNVIYAIKRALLVFFSALISKRMLLMIIVFLLAILLHINVFAVTYDEEGRLETRVITERGYEQETDSYIFDYYLYLKEGLCEGTVKVPSSIYNLNSWFLFIDDVTENGVHGVPRIVVDTSNGGVFNIIKNKDYDNNQVRFTPGQNYARSLDLYKYQGGNSWNKELSYSSNGYSFWTGDKNYIQPNSIIYRKNISIGYYLENLSVGPLSNNLIIYTPHLVLPFLKGTSSGLRLYLGDLHGSTFVSEIFETSESLVGIELSVEGVDNNFSIDNIDLFVYADVEEDEEGNFYIDVPFFDIFHNSLYTGDYSIIFKNYFHHMQHYSSVFGDSTFYDYEVNLEIDSSFEFHYDENSGISIVIGSDDDGQGIDPEQERDNRTAEAINGLGNSIDNMSNYMQDDTFASDTITDNMPSSNQYQDVTENGFDNIFTILRNTFTSSSYTDIVFTVPFSNGQTITIPSSLTENIVPTVIANLVKMVYWFLIARFIVKDIAKYIENAKSGDIFNSTDTNIKTDML